MSEREPALLRDPGQQDRPGSAAEQASSPDSDELSPADTLPHASPAHAGHAGDDAAPLRADTERADPALRGDTRSAEIGRAHV